MGIRLPPTREALFRGLAVLTAVGIAAWRLAAVPVPLWWRDWSLILALFAVYTVFRRESRTWPAVASAVMAFLFGIYVQGQLPHIVAVLGSAP